MIKVFYSKKTSPGGLLDGDWSLGKPNHNFKLGIFSPTFFSSPERREVLEIELMIYHTYLMKLPRKPKYIIRFREWQVCEHIHISEE